MKEKIVMFLSVSATKRGRETWPWGIIVTVKRNCSTTIVQMPDINIYGVRSSFTKGVRLYIIPSINAQIFILLLIGGRMTIDYPSHCCT